MFSRSVYDDLVNRGVIVPANEVPPPTVPMDYSWARVSMLGPEYNFRNVKLFTSCSCMLDRGYMVFVYMATSGGW